MLVNPKQCNSCIHEPVCGLKDDVQLVCMKIEEINLDDREFITISTKCRHYVSKENLVITRSTL